MLKPYAYLDTRGQSRDVSREAPDGARVALHFPELGRTVELEADARGRYAVTDRPAPGHGGPTLVVVRGELDQDAPGTYDQDAATLMLRAADAVARINAGETVGTRELAGIVGELRTAAERRAGNVTEAAR